MTLAIELHSFNKPADISEYWQLLCETGLEYHMDDDPQEIIFINDITEEQRDVLVSNHNAAWEFAEKNGISLWDHIDIDYVREDERLKAVSEFASWLVLRQEFNVRPMLIRMWVSSNYEDYKDSESFCNFIRDNYHRHIEIIDNNS